MKLANGRNLYEEVPDRHRDEVKVQALVYDILPSATATADYAIDLEKLSPNEQVFDDVQTAVCL